MKKIILVAIAAMLVVGLTACNGNNAARKSANHLRYSEQKAIDDQTQELRRNEPLPHFHDSAAMHVQDAYYTADADPNKIWYVTMVALDGTPYAHYTTRGAPQPASDQITNPVQQVCASSDSNGPSNCDTIGLPEPNGVHQGSGADSYIAISTSGAVLRFPAQGAHISDQPFNVKTPIKLSINESAPITHTDASKTTNAVIPSHK